MHSPEHQRKKAAARAEALHHFHNSAVDGKHDDMKTNEHMYKMPHESKYEEKMEEGA